MRTQQQQSSQHMAVLALGPLVHITALSAADLGQAHGCNKRLDMSSERGGAGDAHTNPDFTIGNYPKILSEL